MYKPLIWQTSENDWGRQNSVLNVIEGIKINSNKKDLRTTNSGAENETERRTKRRRDSEKNDNRKQSITNKMPRKWSSQMIKSPI